MALRTSFPSSVRIGIFWKLGLLVDKRPVAVMVWLKEECTRLVISLILFGIGSRYVFFNLNNFLYPKIKLGSSWYSFSLVSIASAVERFLIIGRFN